MDLHFSAKVLIRLGPDGLQKCSVNDKAAWVPVNVFPSDVRVRIHVGLFAFWTDRLEGPALRQVVDAATDTWSDIGKKQAATRRSLALSRPICVA
jgi:hypothetical protein